MKTFATAVTKHPFRVLVAWLVALAAVTVLTVPGGAADPAKVMKADQTDFLPTHYESVRAARLLQMRHGDGAIDATKVREAARHAPGGLDRAER